MNPLGNLLPREERFLASLEEWACPKCGDMVAFKRGEGAPAIRVCLRCEQERAKAPRLGNRADALALAGVPARYREPFLDRGWPKVQGLDSASWEGSPWACGFTGPAGSGKTFLGTELLWRQVQRLGKVGARWSPADAIVDSGFGNGGDRVLWNECLSVRLLLIDDLGWGGREEKLFVLISARHAAKLPTIWTSNHGRAYFVKSPAGEPLARRLCDDGAVFALTERWR